MDDRIAGGIAAGAGAAASALGAGAPKATMPEVIDVSVDYSAHAADFAKAGVRCVMRYFAKAGARKGKSVTPAELKRWHAAGVAVGFVYEDRGGDQGHVEDFGAANGAKDGARALEMARELALPPGIGIYAAVDWEYASRSALAAIRGYFDAFGDLVRGAGFRMGAYACGTVTDMLKKEGLIDLVWLSGAMGWSGTRAARDAGRYDLIQSPWKDATIGGVEVSYDPNKARVADFGQWRAA